ncbi:hypothetical protein Bbelb_361560 [Branchiostoma belcheri]|nr:hypothetical protein Bbelb_361560 [Branchiostoma belcheri]
MQKGLLQTLGSCVRNRKAGPERNACRRLPGPHCNPPTGHVMDNRMRRVWFFSIDVIPISAPFLKSGPGAARDHVILHENEAPTDASASLHTAFQWGIERCCIFFYHLNNTDPTGSIQFTHEEEKYGMLPFLDTLMINYRTRKTDCIYKIPCKSCSEVYIGESGRTFGTRLEEHKKEADNMDTRRDAVLQSEALKKVSDRHRNVSKERLAWMCELPAINATSAGWCSRPVARQAKPCNFLAVADQPVGRTPTIPENRALSTQQNPVVIAATKNNFEQITTTGTPVLLERGNLLSVAKVPRQQIVPRGGILLASLREKITPTPNKTAKEATREVVFEGFLWGFSTEKPAYATVTTCRTCFCVLSTCKNVGNRTASVRGEYHLRTESYGFGSTQTRRRTLSAYFFYVRSADLPPVRATHERATYGLRESNFTNLTCNCCTDSARSTFMPRTVLASSVLTPHFPVDLLNDHAEHTCTIPHDLTSGCQLVSKIPRKAQKKTTRQDPKKRAAEDTRAASDDEVNRRCTHFCE